MSRSSGHAGTSGRRRQSPDPALGYGAPMQVQEIWRFPVKSMQGERLTEATIGPAGIEGDRGWALLDAESGKHLTARRSPELLFASARLAGATAADGVRVTLPDGTETDSDHTLSAWLGRSVKLQAAGGDVEGRFETQADETETGDWFTWDGPSGSFHDSSRAQVSLVSASAFGSWDRRRFRINVVLDQPGDVDLVGQRIDLGGATLEVLKQIDRCVMTTRPQPAFQDSLGTDPAIERDLEVLRTINRDLATFLGIGANTVTAGTVSVGDPLAPITA